MKHHKVKTPHK